MLNSKRAKAINERRVLMPSSCRRLYDKATSGKSLRASIDSHCLECMGYSRSGIRSCTSYACSLYAVRPYQRTLKKDSQQRISNTESKNSIKGV